ncbi:MAG: 30S ribosomal protein S3 [Candidatus Marinimicrobia bacterium]|nr:30S ribosomal protein S3 [Candidatus Neomarinimicrobiota bacterium]MBT3680435.1 30S ribosomal protein S3 [Candidatus Neomarinimicrobiota bacterium]MBT3951296.1 30S ribosomal protein S3 [Candidatus Neomarinimicrobiota bacterium]MBT4254025.1 30S ribosomal protein S3 [Candidatus Neomarinimicrobiota bacterium]MBT5236730.1 30S ribosomal protein S3 [Candidatus Neomarinimicrobiota bacterium]
MGQKTHPVGFRLGFNKTWSSNWFDEKNFADKLNEDILLRKYIYKRLAHAAVDKIDIHRTSKKITISISTARPGIVIGRKGEEVDRLREEIRRLTGREIQINVNEIKRPELSARLVGRNIADQLVKKIAFRRAAKKAIQSTMRMGADGIKVTVSGRLGGAEMSRTETFHEGRVPLHTLRSDIDYALVEAHTTYGVIGVKVWICNGEAVGIAG